MGALSFNQSDARRGIGRPAGRGQFQPPAPLPTSDSDEEADKRPLTDSDVDDKDEDVVADMVAALLVLLTDMDSPSQQSQQDRCQGTWRHRPRADNIM